MGSSPAFLNSFCFVSWWRTWMKESMGGGVQGRGFQKKTDHHPGAGRGEDLVDIVGDEL